jgi:hypothetical protein
MAFAAKAVDAYVDCKRARTSMTSFDWHGDRITRRTPITVTYRHTQNVRRFFGSQCGSHFKFDRQFMAWLKDGKQKMPSTSG